MKFYIKRLYLWKEQSVNEEPRKLEFKENKVNVITGGNGTGKTSIIHIINYCLLTSKPKIPVPNINDTIEWYGINFVINNKDFFIARKRPNQNDQPSTELYFSGIGEVPAFPYSSINESELKLIIEREFGIDENLTVPYGGKVIKAGSKVSFRYFLLLNTQYEDTIADSSTFFDFKIHEEDRYKEALDRIFDLILGLENIEKIVLQQRLLDLNKKLTSILNKEKAKEKAKEEIDNNVLELISKAQKIGLIESTLFTPDEGKQKLKDLVDNVKASIKISPLTEIEELNIKKRKLLLKIRNLESLQRNSEKYKDAESKDLDSIKPIELIENYYNSSILKTFELKFIVDALKEDLKNIKENIQGRDRFFVNIQTEINNFKKEVEEVDTKINSFPKDFEELRNEANKYMFVGELQTLLQLYENGSETKDEASELKKGTLINEISDIEIQLGEIQNSRSILLTLLNERIENIKESVKDNLGVYKTYRAYFNYKDKVLNLIPPGSGIPASNIGSKSNHMYMHLIMIFGIHLHLLLQKNKYVPQFLILDQPSQAYFGKNKTVETNKKLSNSEEVMLKNAYKMMDDFIKNTLDELKDTFQIILLEHTEEEYWGNLANFYLVDNFRNGRALVM